MFLTTDPAKWVALILALFSVIGVGTCGCAAWTERPPIETFAAKLLDEAVIPGVKQGLSRGVEHLTIQAGAQGINPTYVITFEGKWVVGIEGKVTSGVEGVSGQVEITTLSPAGATAVSSGQPADGPRGVNAAAPPASQPSGP